tara:strand:- start:764 stop:901 length:138 start_codon:yes stop_codon:yes gene_type:complete
MRSALYASNLMHLAESFDRLRTNGEGFRFSLAIGMLRGSKGINPL